MSTDLTSVPSTSPSSNEPTAEPNKKVYSLRQVARAIRNALDKATGGTVWLVRAEIVKITGTLGVKHVYLDLVDQSSSGTQAKMRGVIWARNGADILRELGEDARQVLAPGREIVFSARISFHETHGLSLFVERIEIQHMLGEMERIRQQTIKRLTDSGAIRLNGRLPVPMLPQKIALIGSKGTSGYRDFVTKVAAPGYRLNIRAFNATVQGAEAPRSIISALRTAEAWAPDLIVLLRGGGSKMDLACFDDYALCKTISELPRPVWTGIGHESDLSVADMCANRAFKTPTDVAVGVIDCFNILSGTIAELQLKLVHHAEGNLRARKTELNGLGDAVALRARQAIARKSETLEEWTVSVQRSARRSIHEARKEIRRAGTDIERLVAEALTRQSTSLVHLASTLNALHPDRTLERGFSLVRDAQGQVVRDADGLEIGASVEVETYTHRLNAQITSIATKTSKTLPDSQS